MASVTLLKTTCHVEAPEHLDCFERGNGGILWFYYVFLFYICILVTTHFNCSGHYCHTFSCETPAVCCGLKKLHLAFHRYEGDEIMTEFSFWVNYPNQSKSTQLSKMSLVTVFPFFCSLYPHEIILTPVFMSAGFFCQSWLSWSLF